MNAMPINDLLDLPQVQSQGILSEANIILAIDWRAKVDFVLFGTDLYHNSSGSHNNKTLIIFRVAIFGQPDLAAACELVKAIHGQCDLDPTLIRSPRRRSTVLPALNFG